MPSWTVKYWVIRSPGQCMSPVTGLHCSDPVPMLVITALVGTSRCYNTLHLYTKLFFRLFIGFVTGMLCDWTRISYSGALTSELVMWWNQLMYAVWDLSSSHTHTHTHINKKLKVFTLIIVISGSTLGGARSRVCLLQRIHPVAGRIWYLITWSNIHTSIVYMKNIYYCCGTALLAKQTAVNLRTYPMQIII